MGNPIEISFEGTENLEQIFEKLPNKFNRQIMMRTFRKAARPVVQAIRNNTPVRKRNRVIRVGSRKVKGNSATAIRFPGNLKKSVGTIAGKGKYPTLYIGPRMGAKFKDDGWYGRFLIHGTRYIKPNPFVESAWQTTEKQAKSIIENEAVNEASKLLQKYAVK